MSVLCIGETTLYHNKWRSENNLTNIESGLRGNRWRAILARAAEGRVIAGHTQAPLFCLILQRHGPDALEGKFGLEAFGQLVVIL